MIRVKRKKILTHNLIEFKSRMNKKNGKITKKLINIKSFHSDFEVFSTICEFSYLKGSLLKMSNLNVQDPLLIAVVQLW
jgi:hypothetical protein